MDYAADLVVLISCVALIPLLPVIYLLYITSAAIDITITPPNSNMYSAAPCPFSSLIKFIDIPQNIHINKYLLYTYKVFYKKDLLYCQNLILRLENIFIP